MGYRYFVCSLARDLKLVGFVRNLPDGSVEAVARGGDPDLAALETGLRRGPPGARVESVLAQQHTGRIDGDGFEIRW